MLETVVLCFSPSDRHVCIMAAAAAAIVHPSWVLLLSLVVAQAASGHLQPQRRKQLLLHDLRRSPATRTFGRFSGWLRLAPRPTRLASPCPAAPTAASIPPAAAAMLPVAAATAARGCAGLRAAAGLGVGVGSALVAPFCAGASGWRAAAADLEGGLRLAAGAALAVCTLALLTGGAAGAASSAAASAATTSAAAPPAPLALGFLGAPSAAARASTTAAAGAGLQPLRAATSVPLAGTALAVAAPLFLPRPEALGGFAAPPPLAATALATVVTPFLEAGAAFLSAAAVAALPLALPLPLAAGTARFVPLLCTWLKSSSAVEGREANARHGKLKALTAAQVARLRLTAVGDWYRMFVQIHDK